MAGGTRTHVMELAGHTPTHKQGGFRMKCPEYHDECEKCEAYQDGKCLVEEAFILLMLVAGDKEKLRRLLSDYF